MSDLFSEEILREISQGGDEIQVHTEASSLDYCLESPITASVCIGKLLLFPQSSTGNSRLEYRSSSKTPFGEKIEEARSLNRPHRLSVMTNWQFGLGGLPEEVSFYPILLYNMDYKDTRRIFDVFLSPNRAHPAYLALFCMNLFHQTLGLSHTAIKELVEGSFQNLASAYKELFSDVTRIEKTIENFKQPMNFYGGATNTVINLYKPMFEDPLFKGLNLEAERLYDLGGGFNTSEINRCTGKEFTSADIISPVFDIYDMELVLLEAVVGQWQRTIADTETHDQFMQAQRAVPYLSFDAFRDSFPNDSQTYTIVSTGFMTSTVRTKEPLKHLQSKQLLKPVALSVYAIYRIMELVHQGKDVDLLTIQRATNRVYKYKTCFLQWRNGKLIHIAKTNDNDRKNYLERMLPLSELLTDPLQSPFLQQ